MEKLTVGLGLKLMDGASVCLPHINSFPLSYSLRRNIDKLAAQVKPARDTFADSPENLAFQEAKSPKKVEGKKVKILKEVPPVTKDIEEAMIAKATEMEALELTDFVPFKIALSKIPDVISDVKVLDIAAPIIQNVDVQKDELKALEAEEQTEKRDQEIERVKNAIAFAMSRYHSHPAVRTAQLIGNVTITNVVLWFLMELDAIDEER